MGYHTNIARSCWGLIDKHAPRLLKESSGRAPLASVGLTAEEVRRLTAHVPRVATAKVKQPYRRKQPNRPPQRWELLPPPPNADGRYNRVKAKYAAAVEWLMQHPGATIPQAAAAGKVNAKSLNSWLRRYARPIRN